MKFHNVVEQALDRTSLKRVRMKTDPANRVNPQHSDPYEGYIIEENEGMLKIMVIRPDVETADTQHASPCELEPSGEKTFDLFKQFMMKYLYNSKKCDHSEATHRNILHAGDIQHLEAFMKEQGIEREEFEKLTKLFLMS